VGLIRILILILLLLLGVVVVSLRMESAVLSLLLLYFLLGLFDPLDFVCGGGEDVENSEFLGVPLCHSLSVILSIALSSLRDLRLESAILICFLSNFISFGLNSQSNESDSVEVEQLEVLRDLGTVRIEVSIFGLTELFRSISAYSCSDLDSFNSDHEGSNDFLRESLVGLTSE
jgi:hypothetical protein